MNSIVSAIGWHMVGAASAASFYAPIGKVRKWSMGNNLGRRRLLFVGIVAHRGEPGSPA